MNDYLNEIFRHADVMMSLKAPTESSHSLTKEIPLIMDFALSKIIKKNKDCYEIEWKTSDLYDYDVLQNTFKRLEEIGCDYGFDIMIRENAFYPHIMYIRILRV